MNPEKLPTYEEIAPLGGVNLDEEWAAEMFLGKTLEEAKELLMDISGLERLKWMGPIGFSYYLLAIIEIFQSGKESSYDICDIDCLVFTISFQLDTSYIFPYEILKMMQYLVEMILKRSDNYQSEGEDQKYIEETQEQARLLYQRLLCEIELQSKNS